MATGQMNEIIQHLRRTVLLRDGAGLTDGQLLEDYLSRRDETALAALVRRHGPMVWGVCRRVLSNHHDAEDAFQATFLVLVRKAASIASRELLANWLYGVAHQTALKARAAAARRRVRERQVSDLPEPAVAEPDRGGHLQLLLDEELSRLPDKYRAVIVLCDLEGKTRKETARQLNVPEGTVAGRLARARAMLAKRLARRGLAVAGEVAAVATAQGAASGGVSPAVVSSTIQVVRLSAAGPSAAGLISIRVAALTKGVMQTMWVMKLKSTAAVLLLIGALGAGGLVCHTQAATRVSVRGPRVALVNMGSKGQNAGAPAQQPPAVNPANPFRDLLKQGIPEGAWVCPMGGDYDREELKELVKQLEKAPAPAQEHPAATNPISAGKK